MLATPFVKYEDDTEPFEVETTGCKSVSAFIFATKMKLQLEVPVNRLALYRNDGITKLAGKLRTNCYNKQI